MKNNKKIITSTIMSVVLGGTILGSVTPVFAEILTNETTVQSVNPFQEATDAVVKAETTILQSDVDVAQLLINSLAHSEEKIALQNRLNAVQTIIDLAKIKVATDVVSKAEKSKVESDVVLAQALIRQLPESKTKTDLQIRINVVKFYLIEQEKIKLAVSAIEKAEASYNVSDVSFAQKEINLLSTGNVRTVLQNRLNNLVKNIASLEKMASMTKKLLSKAEHTKASLDVQKVEKQIKALPSGFYKTYFTNGLNALKSTIKKDVQRANNAIIKAEKHRTKYYKNNAQVYINQLGAGYVKNLYQKRLNKILLKNN